MATETQHQATNSRRAAADIVYAWLRTKAFPDRLVEGVESDRAFVMEVVYGVIRWYRSLEWIRTQFVPHKPNSRLNAFLLVGLYQLFFMDHVAPYAAVNETVEGAKHEGAQAGANLVNAVLRRAQARQKKVREELARQSSGVRLSHPDILIQRWEKQFGEGGAAALCAWNNQRPDIVARVNGSKISFQDFCDAWRKAGLEVTPHRFAPDRFVTLSHGTAITELPGFVEGWFTVQDPATTMAPELLNAQPGERILDACCAPGGKTVVLAEHMRGQGTLVAADPAPERLARVRENVRRLGLDFVTVLEGDISRPDEMRKKLAAAGPSEFDAVLLDVPCTNTGVLRRRPDARWRFSRERLLQACEWQKRILEGAGGLLAPGGRIVYSTCSLEPEENEEQVGRWLESHPDFKLVAGRRLFPPETGTDGAYAALLVRRKST